jgi:uncharacterized damage-inducible protein DinB
MLSAAEKRKGECNMQPEQGLFFLQTMMPALKNEQRTTRSVIEAIPAANSGYRPDANSKSAMELAWHISAAQNRFLGGIVAGGFDYAPLHQPESVKTPADISQWYGESSAKHVAGLSQLTGEQLVKVLDFRGLIQWPAVMYLQFDLSHEIHHRGQLSTYLRPMGGKVPAIYGNSYDSAEANKAAGKA